jgi:hypothetical protein
VEGVAVPNETWSEGRSVNAAKQIPPMSFDCSGWESDIPTGKWSEGRSVNAAKQIPSLSVDCSTWDRNSPAWIVLQTTYSPDTPKKVVAEKAFTILTKLRAEAPDLKLEYDDKRSSEPPDQRRVTIVIVPTVFPTDLRMRLVGLLSKVCNEPNAPISGLKVEWDDEPTRTAA